MVNISQSEILHFITKRIFSFFIVLIFLIFLSHILPDVFFLEKREFQLLEIIQNIILIYILVLHFNFRKLFLRVSNLFTYLIRQIFTLFILYEELSFLTFNINNSHNMQQEFNLHNSYLIHSYLPNKLFSFTIPLTSFTLTLTIKLLLYFSILFILGYGSYFSYFKKFKYFFLDKQFAIYTFIYFVNILISSFVYDLTTKNITIKGELLELFFYLLFLLDTLKKRSIMSAK